MTTIVLAVLLALALAAFALREGLALSWLWTGVMTLIVGALFIAILLYFRGTSATLTALRDKLVDDVGTLWKRWSTRLATVQLAAVVTWWGLLPAEWKAAVPNWVLSLCVGGAAMAFVLAQTLKQANLTPPAGDQ